jgi:hypothetical protein
VVIRGDEVKYVVLKRDKVVLKPAPKDPGKARKKAHKKAAQRKKK